MKPKWDKIPLNQVSNPKQWPTIPARDLLPEGYPVYGANGLIGYYNQYNHEHETILLTCRGATCGSINISAPRSYVTGNAMCLDDLDQNRCNLKFLYHALTYRGLKDAITGSAQPQITRQSLEKVSIPLPPLEEQKRIAAILDQADAIRRKREESLQLADAFLRSVFLDMFGDPVTNPKGWKMRTLGTITSIDATMVDPRGEEYKKLFHYGPDRIEKDTGKLLPAQTAEQDGLISGKFLCTPGEILYSKIRPYLNKVALVEQTCLCSADVYPVRTDVNIITKEYLVFLLRSNAFLDYVASFSRRANIPKLNRKQFAGYNAPVPPLDLQQRFAAIVESVEQQKARIREQLAEAEGLFASLQQRAFKGEL
jgi:type I restriction enzyme S subunit